MTAEKEPVPTPLPPEIISSAIYRTLQVMADTNVGTDEAAVVADNVLGVLYRNGYIVAPMRVQPPERVVTPAVVSRAEAEIMERPIRRLYYELLDHLRSIEFIQQSNNSRASCPACGCYVGDVPEHDADCWLAAAIKDKRS